MPSVLIPDRIRFYPALSIAMGSLSPTHKPDYSLTEPPVEIPPNKTWFNKAKIIAFDPPPGIQEFGM